MKLLFVLSEYLPDSGGGIISYYAGVLPWLVRAGHEVDVLVASRGSLDRDDCKIDGVRVAYLKSAVLEAHSGGFERFRIAHPAFHAFLPLAWAAHRQVHGGKGYDLVETTDFPMLYAPWVAEPSAVPVNISLHGSPGQLDWFEHPGGATLDTDLLRLVERAAFTTAGAVQANSAANADFWRGLTHREIPVLLPSFRPSIPPAVRERSGLGLVVGRLQTWNGPRVLCRALESMPGVAVRWIGRETQDPATGQPLSRLLASEFPEVFGKRLLHEQPMPNNQVREEIAASDFLCVPSTWDVFNLTVVEAMELGTPVICSTEAGASMLIRHGGNGFLFDPDHPSELADAVHELRGLTPAARTGLADAARQTVADRLAPEALARERTAYYLQRMATPTPTFNDPWLVAMLSPDDKHVDRGGFLKAFTSAELLRAASRQIVDGVQRRMGGGK